MIPPDPLQTIQRRVSGYQKGVYTLMETVHSIISEVDETIVQNAVARLPEDLLTEIRATVDAAPRTEGDWGRCYSIHAGIYRVPAGKTEADVAKERDQEEKKLALRYRNGIQVLRKFFGTVR